MYGNWLSCLSVSLPRIALFDIGFIFEIFPSRTRVNKRASKHCFHPYHFRVDAGALIVDRHSLVNHPISEHQTKLIMPDLLPYSAVLGPQEIFDVAL